MATSLISTGVQFPDSSIQTSAAAAPAGATSVGGAIFNTGGYAQMGYGANDDAVASGKWTVLPAQPFTQSGTISIGGQISSYAPFYSTFYGGWITIMTINVSTPTQNWICLSTNGISWTPIMRMVTSDFDPNSGGGSFVDQSPIDKRPPVAVDESNGRIFAVYGHNNLIRLVHQTTIGAVDSTWNSGNVIANGGYQQPRMASFQYVNMGGVTANSGIVCMFKTYGSGTTIRTVAAGGVSTDATTRFTGSGPANNNYGGALAWSYAGLKAMGIATGTSGACSVSTNINQSWTAISTLPVQPDGNENNAHGVAMSSSYNAWVHNGRTSLYYSTTFGSWTNTGSLGIGEIAAICHNGTRWIALTNTGLVYTSSNATPTGFSLTRFKAHGGTEYRSIGVRQI